jgi:hypothetical protein
LALQGIANAVRPHFTAGVFLPLSLGGKSMTPRKIWASFNRVKSGIVNPDYETMDNILNHFRVFSVQSFKQIPKFVMVNLFGKYYEDRIIFLI